MPTLIAILWSSGALPAQRPDFRGTWMIDSARSSLVVQADGQPRQLQTAPTQILKVEGDTLFQRSNTRGPFVSTQYTLDGVPRKVPGERTVSGRNEEYTARWDGDSVVLVRTVEGGSTPTIIRSTFSLDGGRLVQTVNFTSAGVPAVTYKVYYNRAR